MATQNVLDSLGNIIGSITYPDGTAQSVFDAALTTYSASSATPLILNIIDTVVLSQVGNVTTSASQPSTIPGMTATPPKGTYVVQFSGSINTNGSSASGTFGIYINGNLLPETNRPISCNLTLLGGLVTVSVNSIGVGTYSGTKISLDGASTIDVRFASTNGGTIGFAERVLTLMQVGS